VYGQGQFDRVYGNAGADVLRGGPGGDLLYGDGRDLSIDGGGGEDLCSLDGATPTAC
jgi:serralysin